MYAYIIGKVSIVKANSIVVENNQIGYFIYVANGYSYTIGEEVKIYTYNHIREEEYSLYGFKSLEEQELFLKLLSVKGLGPKMAITILGSASLSDIGSAINSENVNYIKKFPKIGDKLARQMILDLKGKLINTEINKTNNELTEALETLGYKAVDIKKIINKVDNTLKIEEQIKQALKLLLK